MQDKDFYDQYLLLNQLYGWYGYRKGFQYEVPFFRSLRLLADMYLLTCLGSDDFFWIPKIADPGMPDIHSRMHHF